MATLEPKPHAIILDIEGTTTSISFVKETLFPYVRQRLPSYFDQFWGSDKLQADLDLLKKQAVEGLPVIDDTSREAYKESVLKNVFWQMDRDRKTTGLKQLQGHIWSHGYAEGLLKGHLYDDVLPSLKGWKESAISLYIYSSGSVEAQKLLFGHSIHGNVLDLFSGHFDTSIGQKVDHLSYAAIAKAIGEEGGHLLFLTDVSREAKAAAAAGLAVILVVREGNVPLSPKDEAAFRTIRSFDEIVFS